MASETFEWFRTGAAFGGLALGVLNLVRQWWRDRLKDTERVLVSTNHYRLIEPQTQAEEQCLCVHVVNRSDHAVTVTSATVQRFGVNAVGWIDPVPRTWRKFPRELKAHEAFDFFLLKRELDGAIPHQRALQGQRVRVHVHLSTGASGVSKYELVDWP
jgi:hypothetical protein